MTRDNTSPRPRPDLDPIQNGQAENRGHPASPHPGRGETTAQGTISPPRPTVPHLAPGTPPSISPPRPSPLGDGGEGAHLENQPPSPLGIDWEARLQTVVAETVRKRAERRDEREQKARQRDAGLRLRYAEKTARAEAAAVIPAPDGRCRYLVDDRRACPNTAVPSATLCRPHLAAAVRLAQRLGLA
jgi:hypothetical protein